MTVRPPVTAFGSVDPATPTDETNVDILRQTLLDTNNPLYQRFQAIFGLRNVNTDESATAIAQAMLNDESALLRHECAYVLGQMQRAVVIPQLAQAMRDDQNSMVRHEAAEALGAIGTDDVVQHLRRGLTNDPAIEVRESCQLALAHLDYLKDSARL